MILSRAYKIVYGWDVERWETVGIKYCAIYVKLYQSLDDPLLVQYSNGQKRENVNGQLYLYTNLEDALQWIENEKQKLLTALNFKILELNVEIANVHNRFSNVIVESIPDSMPPN